MKNHLLIFLCVEMEINPNGSDIVADFVLTCRGMSGMASMESLSLGTPCSTSLSDVTLSAAEKPTLLVSSTAIIVGISGSRTIFQSSAYVSNNPGC